ncbi:hypothetical protein CDAR_583611 [Caerostris darwini]|uniref:Maturase n=1 Tax=Caerostris darwini TaxID=1538125 RepID=A0AAV4N1C3_9ARAC|nr:hypothetical protein CDAR_583611 [Caerostris darwini]
MMNELQSKLIANGYSLDIPLPQIVVVGSQSAEKQRPREHRRKGIPAKGLWGGDSKAYFDTTLPYTRRRIRHFRAQRGS